MKYLKCLIITLLLIPSLCFGGVIVSGNVTQANAKKSLIDGAAFIDIVVDLSTYVSADTATFHKYEFRLIDSAGKIARGWIGASGGGWTYTEEVTGDDSDFDTVGNWGTLATSTITGGYDSGDGGHATCLRIESGVGAAYEGAQLVSGNFTSGELTAKKLYIAEFDYKWISKAEYGRVRISLYLADDLTAGVGSWTAYSSSFIGVSDYPFRIYTDAGLGAASDEMLLDNLFLKQATDCSTNGVHILSTKTGSTQNWAFIDPVFDYNDSSNYTYEIRVSGAAFW